MLWSVPSWLGVGTIGLDPQVEKVSHTVYSHLFVRFFSAGSRKDGVHLTYSHMLLPLAALVCHWLPLAALAAAVSPQHCGSAMRVALNSSCPLQEAWLDVVAPLLARHAEAVFFNVGANKGYAVAEFIQRFNASSTLTNTAWEAHIKAIERSGGLGKVKAFSSTCGICGACLNGPPRVRVGKARRVRSLAIELVTSNANLLSKLFRHFQVDGKVVHRAALDVADVSVIEPGGVHPTSERSGIKGPGEHRLPWDKPISTTTIDQQMAELDVHRVHLLTIDTEGHDAIVLRGADGALKAQRIDVLEFEYHGVGKWRERSLRDTLEYLDVYGYRCFWQGNALVQGALAPASGPHWCDAFEFKSHSNLVCAYRADVLEALDRLCV